MQITLPNSLAVWPIACASGERCNPMAVRLFTSRLLCCALWPQWQRSFIALVSLGLPLFPRRGCSLSSVSLLPRLSHFSESASGERPRGSKVLPCPPRPQPLTASEIPDDRRLWHISGQPPSGSGPKEKVHTSRFWRRSLGEKKIARHKAVTG